MQHDQHQERGHLAADQGGVLRTKTEAAAALPAISLM